MEVTTGKRRFQGMQKSLFYKGFRHFQRGKRYRILSPLCLPIPSHRRVSYYSALRAVCQSFDGGEFVAMLYVPPRVESGSPNA